MRCCGCSAPYTRFCKPSPKVTLIRTCPGWLAFVKLVGNDDFPEHLLPFGADEEYEESELDESDLDEEEIKQVEECEYINGLPDEKSQQKGFFIHSTPSIVHVLAADGKFLRGRAVGAKYCDLPCGVRSIASHSVNSVRMPSLIDLQDIKSLCDQA